MVTKSDEPVYWAIYARANDDGLWSEPLALIAAELSISLRTVQRAVKSLCESGRLELVSATPGNPAYYSVTDIIHNEPVEIVRHLSAVVDDLAELSPLTEPATKLSHTHDKTVAETVAPHIEQRPAGESDPHANRLGSSLVGSVGWGQSPAEKTRENPDPTTELSQGPSPLTAGDGGPDYLRCDCDYCACNRPKLADETHCPWCTHPYAEPTPTKRRAEWHPSEGPQGEAPPTEALEQMRQTLRVMSTRNRFRKW